MTLPPIKVKQPCHCERTGAICVSEMKKDMEMYPSNEGNGINKHKAESY